MKERQRGPFYKYSVTITFSIIIIIPLTLANHIYWNDTAPEAELACGATRELMLLKLLTVELIKLRLQRCRESPRQTSPWSI